MRKKRRLIPRVEYVNFKREYPNSNAHGRWFSVRRYWSGRLVYISIRHHTLVLDFRRDWVADMIHGD